VHGLIAGLPPFDAESMTALCAAILQDSPKSLRASRPDVPPQLEAVILTALEKDRARRFQNMAQFAAALAPFGTAAAFASAERIARVLGIHGASGSRPIAVSGGHVPFAPGSPMAATTSPAVTDAAPRRSSTGAVVALSAIGGLVVIGLLAVGSIAMKHRASSGAAATAGPASPPANVVSVAPPIGAPPLAPTTTPSGEGASTGTSGSAAADSPTTPASAVPGGARPNVPSNLPGVPHKPGSAPARPGPSGAPAAKPPSNPANPFGDDRNG